MINTQAIKKSILKMAFEGNLVIKSSGKQTGADLYAIIKNEKVELTKKAKARVDSKINNDFSSAPFTIPDSWCWAKLGDLGLYKKGPFGSALTKSMFVEEAANTIKVYEQKNAIQHDATLGNYFISNTYFLSNMQGFEVLPGDIIVSCAGTIGETYIMPDGIKRGIINQALMKITLVPSININYFLYYFDFSIKKQAQNGNGMAIVNIPPFDTLKNLLLPLPPLEEQNRIVEKIDEAFAILDRIDELQREYSDNKEALIEKIIHAGINGHLLSKNSNSSYDMVPLWSVTIWDKKFKGVSKDKQNKTIKYKYALASELEAMNCSGGDVFLLSTGSFQGYTTETIAKDFLKVGEVVTIPWGGSPIIKYYKGKFVTSDNRIATSKDTKVLLNRFLFYCFLGNKKYIKSAYRGTGLEHPEMLKVLNLIIPLPPIEEQARIVEKLDSILPLCQ